MSVGQSVLLVASLVGLCYVDGVLESCADRSTCTATLPDSVETAQTDVAEDLNFGLPLKTLVQLLNAQLSHEDHRAPEKPLSFHEFAELEGTGCPQRAMHLLNLTLTLRDQFHQYHEELSSISSVYLQLLEQLPLESSWSWLVASSHEQFLEKMHAFWGRTLLLALDRHPCFLPGVRNVILQGILRWKELSTDLNALLWNGFAFGTFGNTMVHKASSVPTGSVLASHAWCSDVLEWFEAFAHRMFEAITAELPNMEQAGTGAVPLQYHNGQGAFVRYEYLRRKSFGQWALDRGLLRNLLRHVWKPVYGRQHEVSVADFGAGGGLYSTWLNETGLVTGFAFDGTVGAAEMSGGTVQEINLVEDVHLWRVFDWVMCLEVGEHIPAAHSVTLLQNVKRHARKGIVMSWSNDWDGIGHVNCLSQEAFVDMVQKETSFVVDWDATDRIKEGCEIDYIAKTVAVFRAPLHPNP